MSACQKHFMFFIGCLSFACMLEPAMRAQEESKNASHSILGTGHGIDHVGIAVGDLETAKKDYRDVLGFTVFAGGEHPAGSRNSGPVLESGYLELITFWERTKALDTILARFLENYEGVLFVGLDVFSVDARYTSKLAGSRMKDCWSPSVLDRYPATHQVRRYGHRVNR